MKDKKFITSIIFLCILAVSAVFVWYVNKYSSHAINTTATCATIFKEKSVGYFGDVGKSRFVFNKKMNTCLILNTNDDEITGEFRLLLVDMISDDILFVYTLPKEQEKDATYGLTKEEALNKVRSFGFVIF
jgi:hypothetical protein